VCICPTDCRRLAEYTGLCDVASNAGSPFNRFIRKACSPSLLYRPTNPDERNPPEPQLRRHLAEEAAEVMRVTADPWSVKFAIPVSLRDRTIERIREVNPKRLPLVIIHVGPSWPVREWPMERWPEFIERLSAATDVVVIQIGTDLDSYQRTVKRSRIRGAIDWVNQLDLAEIAALLEQASLFVGIDSGPIHIATTLGIPTIGLFGPTIGELRVHPRARSVILHGGTPCLGCHHNSPGPTHWRTGCPHDIDCMKGISVDRALAAALSLLTNDIERAAIA
jgi:ADP-heptose:LPS heptosyltransferase